MDKDILTAVFRAALAALDPADLVEAALRARGLPGDPGRVTVLALGKAAVGMVEGAVRVFGDRAEGVVVSPEAADLPAGFTGYVGSHPVPDERSLRAGKALLTAAAASQPDDLVICMISGGGSSLAEVPIPGVTIDEVALVTSRLLASGAAIDEINTVRRALSAFKGGGLAAAIRSPRLVTLAISDVGRAPPETIASGPTGPVARDGSAARRVLVRYGLDELLSAAASAQGVALPEPTAAVDFEVIADGASCAAAAVAAAARLGLTATVADRVLAGEASAEARRVVATGNPGCDVAVHWGETTVTVVGGGSGGRNHEAALAAALAIDGERGVFLAAGTDGIDGTTSAAGAAVDGMTAQRAREAGLDPEQYLADNDSGGFFDLVPGRIVTGPTGTNVADIWLCAVPS